MKLSIITPTCRGVKNLTQLLRDFKNQTFKDFEHIIVHDGKVPPDVQAFMKDHENDYDIKFVSIPKDMGNTSIAPGTKPRNHGLSLARGEYVVFADDDDRYKDTYAEILVTGCRDNIINVVQMSASEHRINGGNPRHIKLIPEVGLPTFPMICHVGTPCFIVKREWALIEPWREEPEHDFHFIKRICDRFQVLVRIVPGMLVDVDGEVTVGMKDWVSIPPFYRD